MNVENKANKAVKGALLISRANKQRFGKLKNKLANNYLLGTNQYPNTFEKALRILGNYQSSKSAAPYRLNLNGTEVAFLQRGGRQGGRGSRGGQEKGTAKRDSRGGDTSNDVSTMTGCSTKGQRTNSKGESHYFHCEAADHWAYKCPELTGGEQQEQLHMTLKGRADEGNGDQDEAHQLLNVTIM